MIELTRFKGPPEPDLIKQIAELDQANMEIFLNSAGIDFSTERRRETFRQSNSIFIIALAEGKVAGYLEYTRSWNDADKIYLSSVQIEKQYRNSKLILRLLNEFRNLAGQEKFSGFETNVQKNNLQAVKLYQKIGFRIEENPRNSKSWLLTADRRLLTESPVNILLDKWRQKQIGSNKIDL
jgi:ribosomal protein S18 acetylase RimI-like enzyme